MLSLLLTLLGIVLLAATLPLVLELAVVTAAGLLPRRRPEPAADTAAFPLAVVVPAHNEEMLVARCVESLRSAGAGGDVPVYVVAHNSTDATAGRAREAGAEALAYDDPAAKGKGHALRYGFSRALAQGAAAVLVIDADSTVSPNLIAEVRRALAAGAEVVQCRYEMTETAGRPNARIAALALRAFNLIRPRGRERLGLSAGILGNGFAIRREVLQAVPYDAFSVVEDLEYHLHLVLSGKRVRFLEDALVSSELPVSSRGEEAQRSRWEGGRLHAARQWCIPLAGRVLRGHWNAVEPLLDLAGMPLAYGVLALLLALLLPGWVRIYAALSLLVVLGHVLAAAFAGPEPAGDLRLLLTAPLYVLWKLRLIPGILRTSGSRAAWVRTERDPKLGDAS